MLGQCRASCPLPHTLAFDVHGNVHCYIDDVTGGYSYIEHVVSLIVKVFVAETIIYNKEAQIVDYLPHQADCLDY